VGTAIPAATTSYDPATGLAATTTSASAVITRTYDKLGRLISYDDGAGNTTTTKYDAFDQPVEVSDSAQSTVTYTYDRTAEPRGIPTSMTDSVAGTFTATYDADGNLVQEQLPGGTTLSITRDETGASTNRLYEDAAHNAVASDEVDATIDGQVVHDTATTGGTRTRTYVYDAIGRLARADDSAPDSSCTRRSYTFDKDTNRTALATSTSDLGQPCADTAAVTTNNSYDSADRIIAAGITYDAFGRTTTQADGTAISYYSNDLVRQETAGNNKQTWNLDAAQRLASWTLQTTTDSGVTWTTTATKTNHYGNDSDNPAWTQEATGVRTRNVLDLGGDLAAITAAAGGTVLQLTDLHGDVTVQLPVDTSQAPAVQSFDEYGNQIDGTTARYGWLGAEQRSAETPNGLMVMGVRLYDTKQGRFLQTDPVPGSSANAYDYSDADPCNSSDPSGRTPKCGKRKTWYGYNMRIVVSRRGGGINKAGYRYMAYYINVQIMGWSNRLAPYKATYAETWGTLPGKRNKFAKLQAKGSWQNLVKIGWAVHYNIQVKPGSLIWTYGAVVVSGYNAFATDMANNCTAAT
jgi:RHS repeat-associated protein